MCNYIYSIYTVYSYLHDNFVIMQINPVKKRFYGDVIKLATTLYYKYKYTKETTESNVNVIQLFYLWTLNIVLY